MAGVMISIREYARRLETPSARHAFALWTKCVGRGVMSPMENLLTAYVVCLQCDLPTALRDVMHMTCGECPQCGTALCSPEVARGLHAMGDLDSKAFVEKVHELWPWHLGPDEAVTVHMNVKS
jgi:hypothetical protein